MGVMKEERKDQRESKHRFEHEELRGWYAKRKVLQSGVVIPDVKQREDWTRSSKKSGDRSEIGE